MAWLNNDGLYIKYGREEGTVNPHKVGEYDFDAYHILEVNLDLTKLSTSAQTILSDTVVIDAGMRIERVDLYVETAGAGTGATLDVGFVNRDDRVTQIDFDGLVAAQAVAGLTTGANLTGSGALVGTNVATPGLLVAKAGTAVFTAGKVLVRIKYYKP